MSVRQFCIDVAKITLTNLKYSGYFMLGFAGILMCPSAMMYVKDCILSLI